MYVSLSADLDISVNVRWTVGTYLLRTYTCRYCRLLLGLVFVCEVCVTGVVVACSVFILRRRAKCGHLEDMTLAVVSLILSL
jgi:hypothetical protein